MRKSSKLQYHKITSDNSLCHFLGAAVITSHEDGNLFIGYLRGVYIKDNRISHIQVKNIVIPWRHVFYDAPTNTLIKYTYTP